MNDNEVVPEIDGESYNDEVDALFVKTQMTQADEEPYDMYIPLSIQMEDPKWNKLGPSSATIQYNKNTMDSNEPVQIPQSKAILQFLWYRPSSQDYENGSFRKNHFQASVGGNVQSYCNIAFNIMIL